MMAEAVAQPDAVQSPDARIARAWEVLDGVPDPEVPAVSVCDLGIVRDVRLAGEGLEIVLTPTYSGCPATEAIERDVLAAVEAAGLGPAHATLQRAPAWTTEWITERGRARVGDDLLQLPRVMVARTHHRLLFWLKVCAGYGDPRR